MAVGSLGTGQEWWCLTGALTALIIGFDSFIMFNLQIAKFTNERFAGLDFSWNDLNIRQIFGTQPIVRATLTRAEIDGCAFLQNLIFIVQCNATFNLMAIFRIRLVPNENIVLEVFIANARIAWICFWVEFNAFGHSQTAVVAFMKRGFVFIATFTGRTAHFRCIGACTASLKWTST